MFYISEERAKSILNIDDVQKIAEIIADAEILFEASLGRTLKKTRYTRSVNGNGSPFLYLEIEPNAVISVEIDGRKLNVKDICGLTVQLHSNAEKGRKNVKITYEAGYDTCPADAMRFFENFLKDITDTEKILQREYLGIKSQSIGDVSVTYATTEELKTLGMNARIASRAMQEIFAKYKVFPFFY